MGGDLEGEAAVECREEAQGCVPCTHGQIIGVFCLSLAWSGKGATGAMSPDGGREQLMASWAGGKKPRLHLSDFNE